MNFAPMQSVFISNLDRLKWLCRRSRREGSCRTCILSGLRFLTMEHRFIQRLNLSMLILISDGFRCIDLHFQIFRFFTSVSCYLVLTFDFLIQIFKICIESRLDRLYLFCIFFPPKSSVLTFFRFSFFF